MHNGGLQNPNYPTMAETNFDYWHWGPDEALSITNSLTNNGIVYSNGTAYTLASMSNAFLNVESWMPGLDTSSMRSWVAPYFNGTRDGSFQLESQLGVKTTGDIKDSSFPSQLFSTATSGANYGILNVPVSDWFVSPGLITYVGQAMESGHTQASIQAMIDFYYNNGLLVNLYSHTLSASSATNGFNYGDIPGPAGALQTDYENYGVNTNLHPRMWPTCSTNLYSWWTQRTNVQVHSTATNNGSGLFTTTFSISGSANSSNAVQLDLPALGTVMGLQVTTNGVLVGSGVVRTNGQVLKLLVGKNVTNAVVSYTLGPLGVADNYSVNTGNQLAVSAPGVLGNDGAGLGTSSLSASLVSDVTNGTLTLNNDGSFSYTPNSGYTGNDSFTYEAYNGVASSAPTTVTITVMPSGVLFFDNFVRSAGADPLAPWQVPVGFGSWGFTNGLLQGTSPTGQNYGYAFVSNNWTDFSLQADIQFPVNNSYGGIGGRLNPATGAHYSAWVFPGSTNIQLLKYTSWSTYTILSSVNLPSPASTNAHTLIMTFLGSQIIVYYDGSQMINVTDNSGPYTSGGIIADMWTDQTPYIFSVDNVMVSSGDFPPEAYGDSYTDVQGNTLTVPSPGVLTNDTGGTGPLTAVLVSGPTDGTLNLNANGGFTYVPTNGFYGVDTFAYQDFDGETTSAPATVTITVTQAPVPVANADSYSFVPNKTLSIAAPGVLGNDDVFDGSNLVAALVSGAAHGTVTLNANGSFTYAPATNFHGNDSFSYQAFDGLNYTSNALVTLNDSSGGILFFDSFARSSNPGTISPWLLHSNNWTVSGGSLLGGPDTPDPQNGYGNVYLTNNWTNYSVQAQIQFSSTGAWGGGIGGRLNRTTGAHYAAWVYPEGSENGAPTTLALIKFTDWSDWGYNGSAYNPMQSVPLSSVGTNQHTVKLAFYSNQIAVFFDGNQLISMADADTANPVLTNGGLSVDMFTYPASYVMSVDNVTASTLVVDNNYTVVGGGPTNVSSPGVLGNDTEVYGGTLTAALVGSPTNGTVSLNPSGGFTYTPTNGAPYDSFSYQATDNSGATSLGTATVSITHTLLSQNISFGPLTNRTYGAAPFTLNASASPSSLPVSFNVQSGPATITNGVMTITGVGAISVIASQAGNAAYSAASNVVQSFNVSPATLTVTANNTNRLYESTNPVFTASYSGFVNGDNGSVLSGNPSLNCSAATNSNVGSYTITPTQGTLSAANYTFTFVNGTLTVNKATLHVTANNKSRQYGLANPVLTYTVSGFLGTDTVSVVSGTAAISTTAVTNSSVGQYPITVTNGTLAATNYGFNFTNGTLTIGQATLLVSADNQSRQYGLANPVLTYTVSGFLGTDTVSVVSGTAAISTMAVTNSSVGQYPITVTNGTLLATNYGFNFTNGTLTIGQATLLVRADNQSRQYGLANPVLTYTVSGFLGTDTVSVVSGTAAISTTAVTNSSVGQYPITVTNGTLLATNYGFNFTNGTLTIGQATLLVRADNQSRQYGLANPVLTYTVSGFLGTDTVSVVSGTAAISTMAVTNSSVGQYPITVTNGTLAATNYGFNFTNGTLTIRQATLLVSADNQSRQYGLANPVLTYTVSGFLGTDTVSVVSGAAAISTMAVTNSAVGQYPITVTNGTLAAANYGFNFTNGTLTIGQATLLVSADNQTRQYGLANPVLTYTVSGFLGTDTVSVVSGAAAISTMAVTNSAVGQYPITVTNGTLAAANYGFNFTNGTLTIGQATLLVSADNQTRQYGLANPVLTYTVSGFLGTDTVSVVSGAAAISTMAVTNSSVGQYPITVTNGTLAATNYGFNFTNGTLTIGQATLLVSADNQSRQYGLANPVLTYTVSGFLGTDTVSVVSGTAAISTTAVTNSSVGQYPITVTNGTLLATNYGFNFTNGTLTIGQATLLVRADNQSRQYGLANPVLTYTVSGFLGTDTVSVVSGTAAISTTAVTNSSVGQYPITVTNGTLLATNYGFNFTNGTLTIGQATLLVSADNQSRQYGLANPVLTYTVSGFLGTDTVSVVSGTAAISTMAVTNSSVGQYPITVTNGTLLATNYGFNFTNGTLTIGQATLLVSADNQSRQYGLANPVLTYTVSGFLGTDTVSVVSGTAAISTMAATNSSVGQYPITVTNGSLSAVNYGFNYDNGILTVTAVAPMILSVTPQGTNMVITWSALSNAVYQVQFVPAFPASNWGYLVPTVTATNGTASFIDSSGAAQQRFYRVQVVP